MIEKLPFIKPLSVSPMTGENICFCNPIFFLPFVGKN